MRKKGFGQTPGPRPEKPVHRVENGPFLTPAREYMQKRAPFLSPTSVEELNRKAKHLDRVLVMLHKAGTISTARPGELSENDIGAFVQWSRAKGFTNSYISKNLTFLKQVCEFAGNFVFTKMKASGVEFPKKLPKDLKALTKEQLAIIQAKAEGMGGWHGEVTKFLVYMYPYTGLRASELRLAELEDLDTKRWRIRVRHPKGEMRYGKKREAVILPPARPAVLRFLEARKSRLARLGLNSEALVPCLCGGRAGFYASNCLRKLKKELEDSINKDSKGDRLEFNWKMFRDTYCQMLIDMNPANLSAISQTMGHATTKTTEEHYGRISNDRAIGDIEKAWEKASSAEVRAPKENFPGYA